MTIALSCSRPIVTDDAPIPYSFGDEPSSCSVRLAIAVLLELRRRRLQGGVSGPCCTQVRAAARNSACADWKPHVTPALTRKKHAAACRRFAGAGDARRLC